PTRRSSDLAGGDEEHKKRKLEFGPVPDCPGGPGDRRRVAGGRRGQETQVAPGNLHQVEQVPEVIVAASDPGGRIRAGQRQGCRMRPERTAGVTLKRRGRWVEGDDAREPGAGGPGERKGWPAVFARGRSVRLQLPDGDGETARVVAGHPA